MTHVYDTGYGLIELACEIPGLWRTQKTMPVSAPVMQVSVRTHRATSARCILSINKAFDELAAKAPAVVMIINVDDPAKWFRKLDGSWLRFRTMPIRKADKLSEERLLNFLEEWYAI